MLYLLKGKANIMDDKFRFDEIDNMMINITSEGQNETWQQLEKEKDAIERCKLRKTYFEALNRIMKEK